MKNGNILVIGDTHIPYVLDNYMEFCLSIKKQYNCTKVVHIGDVIDNHSISYHEHSADLSGPADELDKSIKILKKWYKAFPEVTVCVGNHDNLPERKVKSAGLPVRLLKNFSEMLQSPKGWRWVQECEINNVLFKHTVSTTYTLTSLMRSAEHLSQSLVCGHAHSVAGVAYSANNKNLFFAMAVGCGVDRKSLAFDYGALFKFKPIVGCGVVLDNGRSAHFIPKQI